MKRFYTKEEDDYLRNNYLTKSKAEMAKDLNRTYKSIEKRLLSVLKLKKSYKDLGLTRKKKKKKKIINLENNTEAKFLKNGFHILHHNMQLKN